MLDSVRVGEPKPQVPVTRLPPGPVREELLFDYYQFEREHTLVTFYGDGPFGYRMWAGLTGAGRWE